MLAKLGDSVTTDHISPAGSIKADSPAGQYLAEHGVDRKDFNSYGSRRGNHEVMIRGTFANIRLRNQLRARRRGRLHRQPPDRRADHHLRRRRRPTQSAGVPLVILAGKEYGSGSSRDWAAKGTMLLGVRAVIAESYERIHRSNLIGMGVLPLQYPAGETAQSLGLTGTETFAITGVDGAQRRHHAAHGARQRRRRRVRRGGPHRHPRRGGLLPARRHPAVRPAQDAGELTVTTRTAGRSNLGPARGALRRAHPRYRGPVPDDEYPTGSAVDPGEVWAADDRAVPPVIGRASLHYETDGEISTDAPGDTPADEQISYDTDDGSSVTISF